MHNAIVIFRHCVTSTSCSLNSYVCSVEQRPRSRPRVRGLRNAERALYGSIWMCSQRGPRCIEVINPAELGKQQTNVPSSRPLARPVIKLVCMYCLGREAFPDVPCKQIRVPNVQISGARFVHIEETRRARPASGEFGRREVRSSRPRAIELSLLPLRRCLTFSTPDYLPCLA